MTDPAQSHWMGRNWKWFVPVGCLSMMALALAALVGFVLLIMVGIQSTEVFQEALAKARAHPRLIDAIGEPMESSFLTTGSISTAGASGDADLQVDLDGPRGGARLIIVATKTGGVWTYTSLAAVLDDDQGRIDLLAD